MKKDFHKVTVYVPKTKDCLNCNFFQYSPDLVGYICGLFDCYMVSGYAPCDACPNSKNFLNTEKEKTNANQK